MNYYHCLERYPSEEGNCWNPLEYYYDDLDEDIEVEFRESELDYFTEIGRETREILVDHGFPVRLPKGQALDGEEVGDDRRDQSLSATLLATGLVVQSKVFRMITSAEDTFLSRSMYNFCEVTSFVPRAPEESFHHARKTGSFTNLGFNDSVVLRIIMDVSKDSKDHSSTSVGKISLLSQRVNTCRAENRSTWMLASLFQDAMLSTWKSDEPKYLPKELSGSGVGALFNNAANTYLYVHGYRGGTYQRIFSTAVEEVRSVLSQCELGNYTTSVLNWRLREKQEYFHGTYAEKVFIPKDRLMGDAKGLPPPLYEGTTAIGSVGSVQNRLVRSRKLITRRQAEREFEQTFRLHRVLNGYANWDVKLAEAFHTVDKARARAKFGGCLTSMTALQRMLSRNASTADVKEMMGSKAFTTISTGRTEFTMAHAVWLFLGGKGETLSIQDLTRVEDMFLRSEVSSDESLAVPNVTLTPFVGKVQKTTQTKHSVGLYQISQDQEQWADNHINRLLSIREEYDDKVVPPHRLIQSYSQDLEWVNDDSGLIAQAIEMVKSFPLGYSSIILISGDIRLARRIANTIQMVVLQVDPKLYLQYSFETSGRLNQDPTCDFFPDSDVKGRGIRGVLCDSGSLSAAAVSYTFVEEKLFKKEVSSLGYTPSGHRTVTYKVVAVRYDGTGRLYRSIPPVGQKHVFRAASAIAPL